MKMTVKLEAEECKKILADWVLAEIPQAQNHDITVIFSGYSASCEIYIKPKETPVDFGKYVEPSTNA